MRQVLSGLAGKRRAVSRLLLFLFFGFFFAAGYANAQTQQPFLFATTQINSNPAVGVFTRDAASGTLSEVANSPFVLVTSGCYPSTMDPQARFLLGPCASGISLYSFNSSTGAVAEVPTSPFAASTGATPDVVIAESTGQFAYALRIAKTTYPTPGTATLDSFVIDAANNVLSQPSTQTFTLPGTFIGVVADPNDHFLQIFLAENNGGALPFGGSCLILFSTQTGLPENSSSGLCQRGASSGEDPVGIAIDARGTLIGTAAKGQNLASFNVFSISPTDGSQQGSSEFPFTEVNNTPAVPVFDPTGQLIYVDTQLTGLRIFSLAVAQSTITITELPTSPFPSNLDSTPLFALPDPAADFTYIGGSNCITAYPIDTTTGYPGTPIQNTLNHNPALNFQPAFMTMPPPGQPISAPGISISAQTLTFGPINFGQTSGPQTLTISSTGNEALTIGSIAFNPSMSPFSETDSCMTHPVLAPGTSCQIFVSYAPQSAGNSSVSLVITDNAAGSPQSVTLNGSAVTPPPPAPQVTLVPGTLNFPGATTQGESSAPQSISVTNSGNAALTFSSPPSLTGANSADFSITANTCTGSFAANASCSVTLVFSPLAAGVRTTTLSLSDNASNSPQSVTINGSATSAATITSPAGTSASVSAGQSAQYALQVAAGAGFNGTLTFACSGLPVGTNCVGASVSLTGGATTNFSLTITTSGSAALGGHSLPGISPWRGGYRPFATVLLVLLVCWFFLVVKEQPLGSLQAKFRGIGACALYARLALACLALTLLGCNAGGGSPQQTVVTPSGTYTITATPSVTASGSSKALQLNPMSLTLIVK